MEQNRGSWGSNIGFLLAAIGSAVGLGNIWGFPYKMGRSGGFTFLAIYLLLDHPDWRVGQCIRESKRLMKGHKGEIFMLDLSFFGWYLLTAIPVVQIYVTPYVQLARAEFYNRLVGCSTAAEEEKAPWEY